jgi:hypothetical protein
MHHNASNLRYIQKLGKRTDFNNQKIASGSQFARDSGGRIAIPTTRAGGTRKGNSTSPIAACSASSSPIITLNPVTGSLGSASSLSHVQHLQYRLQLHQQENNIPNNSTSPDMDLQFETSTSTLLPASPFDDWDDDSDEQQLGLWPNTSLHFLSSMQHVWPLPKDAFEILDPYKQQADAVELQSALRKLKSSGARQPAAVSGAGYGFGFGLGTGLSPPRGRGDDHQLLLHHPHHRGGSGVGGVGGALGLSGHNRSTVSGPSNKQ